jgi:hypothetical protein
VDNSAAPAERVRLVDQPPDLAVLFDAREDVLPDELLVDDVPLDPLLDEPEELDEPESLDFLVVAADSLAAVLPASEDEETLSDFSDLSPPLTTAPAAPERESVR